MTLQDDRSVFKLKPIISVVKKAVRKKYDDVF